MLQGRNKQVKQRLKEQSKDELREEQEEELRWRMDYRNDLDITTREGARQIHRR